MALPKASRMDTTDDRCPLISAFFVISGKGFDTTECTVETGIKPTEVWRQGREDLKQREDLPDTSWSVGFDGRRLYSINDAVVEVLAVIWPRRRPIRTYLTRAGLQATFCCDVTIHVDRPEYVLEPDVIRKMAWLGAGFGLDVFDYSK